MLVAIYIYKISLDTLKNHFSSIFFQNKAFHVTVDLNTISKREESENTPNAAPLK